MSTFEAIFLGIIQGLTEFLPISSSGHLKLMQALLGMQDLDQYILFDLICHLGTLGAIFIFFRAEIQSMLSSNRTRLMQLGLATLPLVPLAIFLKPIETFYQQPNLIGYFFLATALLLYLGIRFGKTLPPEAQQKSRWKAPFFIGCFQALAIFPGISRSGATISGARMLGWNMQEALTFSFLMAIPAILGGITIETLKLLTSSATLPSISFVSYSAGMLTALGVGYCSLFFLQRMIIHQRFIYFAWYCLGLGIAAIIYFNF
ncbi:MAG: UDP-diphosphatase [Parachlamydia sp.]|nr:MAG: UDP-diphosphatase [Parachlamydia sp.]